MKKSVKEKRYFCDFWEGYKNPYKDVNIIKAGIVLSICICAAIFFFNIFNTKLSKYDEELNSYSEAAFKYLDDIADIAIQEGSGIELQKIPDDVEKYEIINENNGITFRCYLDYNKDMQFETSANMTIVLSDDFEIISKNSETTSHREVFFFALGFITSLTTSMIFITLIVIVGCIISKISHCRKAKHEINELSS